jgi:hypothetical protein
MGGNGRQRPVIAQVNMPVVWSGDRQCFHGGLVPKLL